MPLYYYHYIYYHTMCVCVYIYLTMCIDSGKLSQIHTKWVTFFKNIFIVYEVRRA